ncbi:hypothetical protein L6452_02210 [Arctium lappa]|uniref:Uncharacterized protein n=1 Tax=Arctium lappa TaxID=4217 RepID=A0ACB9FKA5_ARCLA|nr:hypothetical protein L6452_02210 [Arctium lappa]
MEKAESVTGLVLELSRASNIVMLLEKDITWEVKYKDLALLQHLRNQLHFQLWIRGQGDVIGDVAEGDAEDINRAVSVARKAFDEGPWPKITAYERSCVLLRFADLVEKHNDELAALQSWNNGKHYEQAGKTEVPMLARLFRYYAGR